MQNTSDIYKALLNKADCAVKTRLTIGGEVYTGPILDLSTNGGLFAGQTPSVGCCVSREINLGIYLTMTIPRMAEINVESRLAKINVLTGEETDVSEWIPKGTFFIDTRRANISDNSLAIHGYDAMLKAEAQYIPTGSESASWPRKMPAMVEDICYRMGVLPDERNVIHDWDLEYPGDLTMREILGYIAACHVGNFTITDAGRLRLVPLVPSGESADIGNAAMSLNVSPAFDAFSGVQFYYDGKDTFSAGDDSGRVLEIESPWATQEIADAALVAIQGYAYQPYEAAGAILDPAMELGDLVTVGGTTGTLAAMTTTFDALCASDISAPADEEVDHEYPYEDRSQRQTRREVAKATASIKVGVDEIESRVEGVEGDVSSVTQKVDNIKLEVKQASGADGQSYASITLRVGEELYTGQILIEGNVNVSGQLSADALYSALGDIADLSVDRLSTSRRIPKYLRGDTSDDNYIRAEDEALCFVSGVYNGGTEQAENPIGLPIYWESDPDADGVSLGADGYPYLDGVRIFTTTARTDWPVYVYTYDELTKTKIAFESWHNIYVPVMTLGAGNEQGLNKGKIVKSADGLEILYKANTGAEIGMKCGNGGYTDIYGLRRTTHMDLSKLQTENVFTEMIEGSSTVLTRHVRRDAARRIVAIYDESGHEATMKWW